MTKKTYRFSVEVTVEDSSEGKVRTHIEDAVRSWGGAKHPDDPFYGLTEEDVRVRRLVKRRKAQ